MNADSIRHPSIRARIALGVIVAALIILGFIF